MWWCYGKTSYGIWIKANSICFRFVLFFRNKSFIYSSCLRLTPYHNSVYEFVRNKRKLHVLIYLFYNSSGQAKLLWLPYPRGASSRNPCWDWEVWMARRETQGGGGPWTSSCKLHHHRFMRLSSSSLPESFNSFTASFFHFSSCKTSLPMYTFLLNPWPPTQKETGSSHETKGAFFFQHEGARYILWSGLPEEKESWLSVLSH